MAQVSGQERFYGYSTEETVPQVECPTDRITVQFLREEGTYTSGLDYIVQVIEEKGSGELVFLKRIGIAAMQIMFGDTFHFQEEISWIMWRAEYVEFLHDLIRAIR